jgi:hypothetical protein
MSPLEQRAARLAANLAQIKLLTADAEQPWWEKTVVVLADQPHFEKAIALSPEYRESLGAIEFAIEKRSNPPKKPKKPKKLLQGYSLQEAIQLLKAPIETALNRHYTFDEIAQILTTEGIELNADQLRQYYEVSQLRSPSLFIKL